MLQHLFNSPEKIIVPSLVFLALISISTGATLFVKATVRLSVSESGRDRILSEKATKADQSEIATSPGVAKLESSVSQVGQKGQVAGSQTNSTTKVYLGFAVESRSVSRVQEIESQIGRKFPLLMTYVQWGNPPNSKIDAAFFNVFNTTSTVPIISWEPWNPFQGVNQPTYKLTNITAGNFDTYIRESARAIKTYNKPVFLRWAHEMNGNWYPWSGTVNGNSASDYINAYRYIHNIFAQEGVGNVTWLWCPNTWSVPQVSGNQIADYYPGGADVDWVALDGYNFGNSIAGQVWQSFTKLFSGGYNQVVGYGKPIMIAETASSESGGDKGAWIASSFATEIPHNFPRIKALVWFNINKETSWDIVSSPNSISQFKNQVSSEIYRAPIRYSNSRIISP